MSKKNDSTLETQILTAETISTVVDYMRTLTDGCECDIKDPRLVMRVQAAAAGRRALANLGDVWGFAERVAELIRPLGDANETAVGMGVLQELKAGFLSRKNDRRARENFRDSLCMKSDDVSPAEKCMDQVLIFATFIHESSYSAHESGYSAEIFADDVVWEIEKGFGADAARKFINELAASGGHFEPLKQSA